ncbi:AI-2E family transporter [Paenibacillus sp. WQ 127069]|uniref:AI-2E family transporter n=1 Tax=Paenibacillus baimaensis TaxID=2982185 RepID=A0ABT2UJ54_9BACL|nr:AI-2E family transporter [Paenibacillus sp. WQ 127069]MCU6794051.1 AI-2E family transporter [Paenibacillus sp. WQ 127069]
MDFLKKLFANVTVKRFSILILISLLLISLGGMLNLVLLTFLLAYIINSLQGFISSKINRYVRINDKIVVVTIYIVLIVLLVSGISNVLPKIISQYKAISDGLIHRYNTPANDWLSEYIMNTIIGLDFQSYTKQGLGYVFKVGDWGKTFFLSVLLSLFFLLEKNRIKNFTAKFKTSKIAWFYNEMEYFSRKFIVSFGKVIEAQILIAIFNTIFTTIGLWILGFHYLVALSIVVFVLSLIPVAGVIISLIPLSIIGLQLGGVMMVVYLIVMIMVIHAFESYFLNPRLMSSKTKLPMFYTFVILIFSEHFFGIWGLIIGVPVFVFLLDILDVNYREETAGKIKSAQEPIK